VEQLLNDEELVTASKHKEGAGEARLQAIRWDERLLRAAPGSKTVTMRRRPMRASAHTLIESRHGDDPVVTLEAELESMHGGAFRFVL